MRGRRRTEREREGEQRERVGRRWLVEDGYVPGAKREERGEGIFMVPTQGSKIPLDSN